MSKFVIVALEGFLMSNKHRVIHASKGNWGTYYEKAVDDEVKEHGLAMVEMFSETGYRIILSTNSPESMNQQLSDKLLELAIPFDKIHHKATGQTAQKHLADLTDSLRTEHGMDSVLLAVVNTQAEVNRAINLNLPTLQTPKYIGAAR